jgi:hypothetical protein
MEKKVKVKEGVRIYPNFKQAIISGIGWSFGVTIGFVIISTLVVFVLNQLGGLPLIGDWIASIVEETQSQLQRRTPLTP